MPEKRNLPKNQHDRHDGNENAVDGFHFYAIASRPSVSPPRWKRNRTFISVISLDEGDLRLPSASPPFPCRSLTARSASRQQKMTAVARLSFCRRPAHHHAYALIIIQNGSNARAIGRMPTVVKSISVDEIRYFDIIYRRQDASPISSALAMLFRAGRHATARHVTASFRWRC